MRGVVVWEGPSLLDRQAIVLVATGLDGASVNEKTGPVVQTWVLLRDVHPVEAVERNLDVAICGMCRHRGGPGGRKRTCYVNLHWAPAGVWRTYQAGGYGVVDARTAANEVSGEVVRLGAYGDPAAVPSEVWARLLTGAAGWVGYTHQWRTAPDLKRWCMASVDTPEEAVEAKALGWRYFRDRLPEEPLVPGEFVCPASDEGRHKSTCKDCRLCDGLRYGTGDPRRNPVIIVHGQSAPTFISQRRHVERQLSLLDAPARLPTPKVIVRKRKGLEVVV